MTEPYECPDCGTLCDRETDDDFALGYGPWTCSHCGWMEREE